MGADRQQALQQRVDAARDQLEAELGKGVARDKSLVKSYELLVAGLEEELKIYLSAGGTLNSLGWTGLLSSNTVYTGCYFENMCSCTCLAFCDLRTLHLS